MSTAFAQAYDVLPASRARSSSAKAGAAHARNWLTLFIVIHVCAAIGIFLFGNTSLRMPLRIGVYATSLCFLFLIRGRSQRHPAGLFFEFIAAGLFISLLNPDRSSWTAGFAQITLYLAVLAPLVWVSILSVDRSAFNRVVLVLWAFYSLSAIVGVLQVKFPGQFDGAISANYDDRFIGAMQIRLADGSQMLRPKGLTDTAGGAGASGVLSICLGFGVLLTSRHIALTTVVVATIVIGLFNIYLSHGRTNLVVTTVATLALLFVLNRRKQHAKVLFILSVVGGAAFLGTSLAFAVGGEETVKRWNTLLEDSPTTVVYQNRGVFLEQMLTEDIFHYPLGAGSGRWGMMTNYFGDPSRSLWAEMMWQALLYDGGIPLIMLYMLMLVVLLREAIRIGIRSPDEEVGVWAAVVAGFTVATVAASFVYPVYIKAAGLEMILLNACLYGYSRSVALKPSRMRPAMSARSVQTVQDPVAISSAHT